MSGGRSSAPIFPPLPEIRIVRRVRGESNGEYATESNSGARLVRERYLRSRFRALSYVFFVRFPAFSRRQRDTGGSFAPRLSLITAPEFYLQPSPRPPPPHPPVSLVRVRDLIKYNRVFAPGKIHSVFISLPSPTAIVPPEHKKIWLTRWKL